MTIAEHCQGALEQGISHTRKCSERWSGQADQSASCSCVINSDFPLVGLCPSQNIRPVHHFTPVWNFPIQE